MALVGATAPLLSINNGISLDLAILKLVTFTPSLLNKYLAIMVKDAVKDPFKAFHSRCKSFCASDIKIVENPEYRAIYRRAFQEAFRQGVNGVGQDMILSMKDWGFSADEIQTPTHVWHGEQDACVPIEGARRLAAMVPNCTTTFLAKEGHYLIMDHWREILSSAIAHQVAV